MKTELVLDHYDFTVPTWAVCPIEYGEFDGLSDDDIERLNGFTDSLPANYFSVEYGEEISFRNFNDVHNLGDDCVNMRVFVAVVA